MVRRSHPLTLASVAGLLGLALGSTPASAGAAPPAASATVPLRLIATNDFHGNLEPPTGSSGRIVVDDTGTTVTAGGAAYLATHLTQLRGQVKDSVFIGTGDLVGASPLISGLFHDEPTLEFFRTLGMKLSAAGSGEFSEGYNELARLQRGGCHPVDGCQFRNPYQGAGFPYLSANVTFKGTQIPALLPTWITYVQGIPVGYIGATLRQTPSLVPAAGVRTLTFGDEIAAVDKYANLLDLLGVKTIVLLLHHGDNALTGSGPNACSAVPGPAQDIARKVSAKIDVVFSAYTHQAYNCSVTDPAGNPRPFIQGSSFGRVLSVVDLQIDRRTRDVVRSQTVARNRVVTQDVAPDPTTQAFVQEVKAKAGPVANRTVGSITADITRSPAPSGESALGDVIADAMLEQTASAGAQLAFMNPGSVRADLTYASSPAGEGDGVVTYAEAFTVQPFGTVLVTVSMTGAQVKAVLEQQWQPTVTRILQPSQGLTYDASVSRPIGDRVSNLALGGVPVDPAATYRVTTTNFLAGGGDGFSTFTAATNATSGPIDLDALNAYLAAHPSLAPPATNRITVLP